MDDVLISVVFENLRQFCKKFTFFQLMTFDLNSNTASFLYFCMNHEVFASLLLSRSKRTWDLSVNGYSNSLEIESTRRLR